LQKFDSKNLLFYKFFWLYQKNIIYIAGLKKIIFINNYNKFKFFNIYIYNFINNISRFVPQVYINNNNKNILSIII